MGAIVTGALAVLLVLAGTADATTVSPTAQDFQFVPIGMSSQVATFNLQASINSCSPDVHGNCTTPSTQYQTDTTALGGPPGTTFSSQGFTVHNSTCTYPVEASPAATGAAFTRASCQFTVTYSPTQLGRSSLALSFPDTRGPGATATLSLIGAGVPAVSTKKKCKKKHHASAAKKCKKRR